jgi:hypothetical protein
MLSAAPLASMSQQITVIQWQIPTPVLVARYDDFGNTAATATTINMSGSATAGSFTGRIDSSSDIDVFRFTAPKNGQLTIGESATGVWPTLDPHLRVYDAALNLVANETSAGTSSRLTIPVRAGATYYFVAGSDGYTTGRYLMSLAAAWDTTSGGTTTPSPTPTPNPAATRLTLSAAGAVAGTGTVDTAGDSDMYAFTATKTGQMVITETASAGNLDPYVYAYDASGKVLAQNDDDGEGANSWIRFDVTAGATYYVKAAGYGTTAGSYKLQLSTEDPSPFNIDFNFSGLSASDQMIMEHAADEWEHLIVGDLPAVTSQGRTIDDLLIDVTYQSIDGKNGILGQSAPTGLRSGSSLPYRGMIELDSADAQSMTADGSLLEVIVHEMGHVLGLGTIWQQKGLLSGAGTSDPRFTGRNATAEYNAIFHTSATSVPVEAGGGSGTALGHWRESVFGNELMTGWHNRGVNNPLSRITVASMADLGYQVNLAAAEAYTPSASAAVATRSVVSSGATGFSRDRMFNRSEPWMTDAPPLPHASAVNAAPTTPLHPGLVDQALVQDWRAAAMSGRQSTSSDEGAWYDGEHEPGRLGMEDRMADAAEENAPERSGESIFDHTWLT